ncbi:MAG TPA: response regulator [Acetobacteraceae bacterium]|jgi:two-component system, response regulator PdtaR|nr:response regulator [Acetobacteraceae bacterium]
MTALSVLVVEDDAMIGMLLAEMLDELGYTVCAIAATEEDAVAGAARYRPGLMIVDQYLREGNGMSAMDRIRQNSAVPCIFMSGAPSVVLGGVQVLQKPFLEADLVRAIRLVIGPPAAPATHLPVAPGGVIGR